MPSYLARTGLGIFALLLAITLVTERTAAGSALVGGTGTMDLPALHEIARSAVIIATAGTTTASSVVDTVAPGATAPEPEPAVAAPVVVSDAIVLASWYGPGFYGNRTACGQTYTPETLGVANLTLPCGTALTLSYGGRSITVAVIDRGPYVAGRTLDLSNATKLALGCTDLCTLRMQIVR